MQIKPRSGRCHDASPQRLHTNQAAALATVTDRDGGVDPSTQFKHCPGACMLRQLCPMWRPPQQTLGQTRILTAVMPGRPMPQRFLYVWLRTHYLIQSQCWLQNVEPPSLRKHANQRVAQPCCTLVTSRHWVCKKLSHTMLYESTRLFAYRQKTQATVHTNPAQMA